MPSLHLIFARHGVHYALEAAMVQEIAWLPELSAVADASSWVIGAFNNHGRVVAVLDLALCFGRGRSDSRTANPLGSAGGCELSRMKRLTMRSSSEWKLMTTSRPPAFSRSSAAASASESSSSS